MNWSTQKYQPDNDTDDDHDDHDGDDGDDGDDDDGDGDGDGNVVAHEPNKGDGALINDPGLPQIMVNN